MKPVIRGLIYLGLENVDQKKINSFIIYSLFILFGMLGLCSYFFTQWNKDRAEIKEYRYQEMIVMKKNSLFIAEQLEIARKLDIRDSLQKIEIKKNSDYRVKLAEQDSKKYNEQWKDYYKRNPKSEIKMP